MERPRIRHVALNVQDRDKEAEYYKRVFGMEEKSRGPNGTIYLSDGFVGVAFIHNPDMPWGINHFGFQVDSVKAIEETADTTAHSNTYGLSLRVGFATRKATEWTFRGRLAHLIASDANTEVTRW